MNILTELRQRFVAALTGLADDPAAAADLVRPSQDLKFGDYQANCAMPLAKQLGRNPREVAGQIIERLKVDDLCDPPEIAGPGFINLRLTDRWLVERLHAALVGERLDVVPAVVQPKTFVIDYSGPNVAKPMHVGHIRSTVIGDALVNILRFLGHQVVGDNHLGDWGTQFGMILYGYKHFLDRDAYQRSPVTELARLYRLVRQLVDYHAAIKDLPEKRREVERRTTEIQQQAAALAAKTVKKDAKKERKAAAALEEAKDEVSNLERKLKAVDDNTVLAQLAAEHRNVGPDVLAETAKLHVGDQENLRLWREFMPACLEDIERIYRRLGVKIDYQLGESFYHDQLAAVVEDLKSKGIARESDGALCIFSPQFDTPFLVQKRDGAFLYATTDLATIRYRMEKWQPDAILYVVDHRQSLHFEQLFAAARPWGYSAVELVHVGFGTVMGPDGKPYQTRAGNTEGLEGLLDEAVARAQEVIRENEAKKGEKGEILLTDAERQHVAEVVGIGAIKYADLSQNRSSDYEFILNKMVATVGNTGAYMQYAYARIKNIFAKGQIDIHALRASGAAIRLDHPAERLGLEILRLSEALDLVVADYRPNQLTNYLWEVAVRLSVFYDVCPVLKAEDPAVKASRLLLCDLTSRTLKKGLELLGIQVVEKM